MMITMKQLIASLVPQTHSWKVQLLSEWHSIVGNLKTTVTLEKIYEDSLILGVDNSSWMQELYLLSPLLISMVNTRIDQPRIKTLRFKLISRKLKKNNEQLTQKKLKTRDNYAISIQEQQALATINDDALRTALHQFLMRCYQERI